jgi:hypothetical protein
MGERDTSSDRALEERSKELFERSAGAIDAATRSRLTQARVRALQELGPERSVWRSSWLLPVGATAAAALAAWTLFMQPGALPEQSLQVAALGDLELLLGEEDLEMIEELDFYAWLEEQPEFDASAQPADGDGVG